MSRFGLGIPTESYYVIDCEDCGASGVFHDPARHQEGEGVACTRCDGTGAMKVFYRPFAGRKERKDIRTVRLTRRDGVTSNVISYEDFKQGKKPVVAQTERRPA